MLCGGCTEDSWGRRAGQREASAASRTSRTDSSAAARECVPCVRHSRLASPPPSFGHSPHQTLRRRQFESHRDLEQGARIPEGVAGIPDHRHDEWNRGDLRWYRLSGRAKSRGQRSARCPERVGLAGVCVNLVTATMRSITRSPNGRCAAMGRHRHVETRSNLNEPAFGLITGMRKHIFQEAVPKNLPNYPRI